MAEAAGIGIAPIEPPTAAAGEGEDLLQPVVARRHTFHEVPNRLVVEVTAEALKLAGKAKDERLVKFLGGPPSAHAIASYGNVRTEKVVKLAGTG